MDIDVLIADADRFKLDSFVDDESANVVNYIVRIINNIVSQMLSKRIIF